MTILVVAPHAPAPAGLTAQWAHALALESNALVLSGEQASQERFLNALASGISGVAFFGHGDDDRLCAHGRQPVAGATASAEGAVLAAPRAMRDGAPVPEGIRQRVIEAVRVAQEMAANSPRFMLAVLLQQLAEIEVLPG